MGLRSQIHIFVVFSITFSQLHMFLMEILSESDVWRFWPDNRNFYPLYDNILEREMCISKGTFDLLSGLTL